jgi:hypothetical protein
MLIFEPGENIRSVSRVQQGAGPRYRDHIQWSLTVSPRH